MNLDRFEILSITYILAMILWILLALRIQDHVQKWHFTPEWHSRLVPILRALFLLSLPLEYILTRERFIPILYILGLIGTVTWMVIRSQFIQKEKKPFSANSSIQYNIFCTANLICFGLMMHAFICLSIFVNASLILLLIRIQSLKKTT